MEIQVTIKNVYGNEMIYPTCEQAKRFAELAKQKTLTSRELGIIKALGYTIRVVQPTYSL